MRDWQERGSGDRHSAVEAHSSHHRDAGAPSRLAAIRSARWLTQQGVDSDQRKASRREADGTARAKPGAAQMKFRVEGAGWPVDQWLISSGTVIDTTADDTWSRLVRERRLIPPLNASALDDEAWEALVRTYPVHLLGPPPKGER